MAQSYFNQACHFIRIKIAKVHENDETGEHTGRNLLNSEQNETIR